MLKIKTILTRGFMRKYLVSELDSGSRGLEQDTLLSQCLSPPRSKWVPANCQENLMKCCEATCDGLASHPGGVAILLVSLCYRNRDKLWQSWATRPIRLNLFWWMWRSLPANVHFSSHLLKPFVFFSCLCKGMIVTMFSLNTSSLL